MSTRSSSTGAWRRRRTTSSSACRASPCSPTPSAHGVERQHPRPAGFRARRGHRRRRAAELPALRPRHANRCSGSIRNWCRQVDVMRGPVANTYGSGAIGGVVVFETKDADDFLRARRDLGRLRRPAATTPTATAGPPAPPAPTASTMRSTCSATSSGATTATTRTATATRSRGTGFDVLSGLLKATHPSDRQQRIEARLDRRRATAGPRAATRYDLDTQAEHVHGRYNITDDDAELARPARQRSPTTRPISTRPI